MDASLQAALREREMAVEHRINLVRATLLVVGYVLNLFNAGARGLLQGPYLTFLAVELGILAAYVAAVHRLTTGARYRPWVKYVTIPVDLGILVSFYLEMLRPTFQGAVDMPFFRGTEVSLVVVLLILTGLRMSRAAIAYSTALGTVLAVFLACQPGEAPEARYWWPAIVVAGGGLTRFLPRELVALVEEDDGELQLGGKGAEATILMADIRGFTRLSEHRAPLEVVELLNEYFSAMSAVVFRHGGMIDKYIGDAIMAVFGAPLPRPDDPARALAAAREMLDTLDDLNARWAAAGRAPLHIGIAVHTGEVIAGNIGSPERMDYTVIGDAVNLTSRLESLNKAYGTEVLFSARTFEAVGEGVAAELVDETTVRGRDERIRVYTLRRPGAGAADRAAADPAPVPGGADGHDVEGTG